MGKSSGSSSGVTVQAGEFKWLRAQRVKELFGLEVYNWCRCRQGEILDVATAARWGLTEAIRLEEKNAMTVENG